MRLAPLQVRASLTTPNSSYVTPFLIKGQRRPRDPNQRRRRKSKNLTYLQQETSVQNESKNHFLAARIKCWMSPGLNWCRAWGTVPRTKSQDSCLDSSQDSFTKADKSQAKMSCLARQICRWTPTHLPNRQQSKSLRHGVCIKGRVLFGRQLNEEKGEQASNLAPQNRRVREIEGKLKGLSKKLQLDLVIPLTLWLLFSPSN